jgi:tetratricopeptide (TPR) repeat protein
MRRLSLRAQIAVALLVMAVPLLLLHRISEMDGRFVPRSWAEAEGFVRYLSGDYRGAARAYRARLKQLVADKREHIDLASAALLEDRFGDARSHAERQLAKEFSPDAALTLAEVHLAMNEPAQALPGLQRVLEAQPEDYDALLLAAVANARLGNDGHAVDLLIRALRQDRVERRITTFLAIMEITGELGARPVRPECLLAHLHRFLRIYDAGEGAIAVRHAKRAVANGDRADAAWVVIGVVFTKQGKTEQAVEAFHEAARLNPRNAEALRWLAIHYSDRGDVVNELRFAKAAFEAGPTDAPNAKLLHVVLVERLGDFHQARQLYASALAGHPDDPGLWGKLSQAQYQLGDYPDALESGRRAAALDPARADPLVDQAWALVAMQRLEEARELVERATALDPSGLESHYALGFVYSRLHRVTDATRVMERWVQIEFPSNADRLLLLCSLYRYAADFPRTNACLRTVLRMDPKNQQAIRWMRDVEQNLAPGPGVRQ